MRGITSVLLDIAHVHTRHMANSNGIKIRFMYHCRLTTAHCVLKHSIAKKTPLQQHSVTHSKKPSINCYYCPAVFKWQSQHLKHIKMDHTPGISH